MQRIPLDLATETMHCAKPVIHAGKLLVRPGEALSEQVKDLLRSVGRDQICVQGAPLAGYGMGYDAAKVLGRIPFLFRKYQGDQAMMQVSVVLTQLLTERSCK